MTGWIAVHGSARLREPLKPGTGHFSSSRRTRYMATFLGCLYAGIVAVRRICPAEPSLPRVKIIACDADTRIALTRPGAAAWSAMSQMDADFATFDWLAVDTILTRRRTIGRSCHNAGIDPFAVRRVHVGPQGVMVTIISLQPLGHGNVVV